MPARRALSVLVLVLLGSACAGQPERLWYKPGGDYTTQEFHRDRKACTREGKLDHACLKAKGWVSVSPDRPKPPAEEPEQRRSPY